MRICEYGCEQTAKFPFKNGKWCCSSKWQYCPNMKKQISKKLIGKIVSEETKQKIRDCNIGNKHTKETKIKISKSCKGKKRSNKVCEKMKNRIVSEKTRQKISNKLKGRVFSKEHISKIKEARKKQKPPGKRRTIKNINLKYPLFSKIEEMRYNPDKPNEKEIQVHCKNHNCPNSKEQNGWFTPTTRQIEFRISSIESIDGTYTSYFYCSEECKYECPLYGKTIKQLMNINNKRLYNYTQSEYNIWRTEVLERANYKCEYCEDEAIDVHHIKPQKLEPFFTLDPDFGIACCKKCHYKYGHKDECSTGKISQTICI